MVEDITTKYPEKSDTWWKRQEDCMYDGKQRVKTEGFLLGSANVHFNYHE